MQSIVKSTCGTPETHMTLYVHYTSIKKKKCFPRTPSLREREQPKHLNFVTMMGKSINLHFYIISSI